MTQSPNQGLLAAFARARLPKFNLLLNATGCWCSGDYIPYHHACSWHLIIMNSCFFIEGAFSMVNYFYWCEVYTVHRIRVWYDLCTSSETNHSSWVHSSMLLCWKSISESWCCQIKFRAGQRECCYACCSEILSGTHWGPLLSSHIMKMVFILMKLCVFLSNISFIAGFYFSTAASLFGIWARTQAWKVISALFLLFFGG